MQQPHEMLPDEFCQASSGVAIVVRHFGLSWAYGIDVASYVVALTFALMFEEPSSGSKFTT